MLRRERCLAKMRFSSAWVIEEKEKKMRSFLFGTCKREKGNVSINRYQVINKDEKKLVTMV